MRRAWLLGLALVASCASTPRDPFRDAERRMERGDLLGALVQLDQVPVDHARYPEARAMASSVERRMRKGHELLLDGLMLRGEWRDPEAVAAFQAARAIWSSLPGIDNLIKATQNRQRTFTAPSASPSPAAEPRPVPSSAGPEILPASDTAPAAGAVVDPLQVALAEVNRQVRSGDLEGPLARLRTLHQDHPGELRVRVMLVRLFRHRALIRYGQGLLREAQADWEEVARLDPDDEEARRWLAAVKAEREAVAPQR